MRRTITIPVGLTTEIRTIQAEILVKEQKNITFNGTVLRLLEEAINNRRISNE